MRVFRASVISLLLLAWAEIAAAASSPRYHTVAAGQRLGSIARRYGVSIAAICNANGIERSEVIKVGQKLLVPPKSDKDGSRTRHQYGPPEGEAASDGGKGETVLASLHEPVQPKTHRVAPGQRLGSIARRYHVTVAALCEANHIRRHDIIRPGQVLTIPGTLPDGGLSKVGDDDKRTHSSKHRKGYMDLSTYTTRYRGVVFDRRGKVQAGALESISRLFAATGKRPRVDARLVALLADVSEHFDFRPIRVVSGWRDHSYFEDSRHKHSQAVDFSIPGVANTVVRDYIRRYRNCGVGYYPNSSFVHLDVRDTATYWVDYAGPGEPPRSRPRRQLAQKGDDGDDSTGPIEEAGADVDDRPESAAADDGAAAAAAASATKSGGTASSVFFPAPAKTGAPSHPSSAAPKGAPAQGTSL